MKLDDVASKKLDTYLESIGEALGHPKRLAAFATYVVGLLSPLKRKSAESIAAMNVPDKTKVDAEHQRLLHIIGQSRWDDRAVRRCAAAHALSEIQGNRSVDTWVIDDTGWIKKGTHSVGVQRQYTGTSGKVDNCQIGVSLTVTAADVHLPIDFELYLPKSWTENAERRAAAKIPKNLDFMTKPELAVKMIDQAIEDGIPRPEAVLADAGYGNSNDFRRAVRARRLHYAVSVRDNTRVFRIDKKGIRRGPATTVARIAEKATFRKVTWANGSKAKMTSRFAFFRVVPLREKEEDAEAESIWLVLEWPYDEEKPCKFCFCSLPLHTSHKKLAKIIHQRWRTERAYEDLKQEFGLDHYEGRSFVGWHHHVTAALVCYAFAVSEQARLFPPAATPTNESSAFDCAA